jgi:DNA-binding NarL/FixJ family response regulator
MTKKVLLVDDEPWLTEGLAAALEARGFECMTATDMTSGVKALQQHNFGALVTDIMMPPGAAFLKVDSNESGFHLIEYVQEHWPRLPIVCLSVIADQAKIRLLTKRGVRYLRKGETPLDTAVEVVTSAAEGRTMRLRRQ